MFSHSLAADCETDGYQSSSGFVDLPDMPQSISSSASAPEHFFASVSGGLSLAGGGVGLFGISKMEGTRWGCLHGKGAARRLGHHTSVDGPSQVKPELGQVTF